MADLGSLKDLANDWHVPVIAVAAVEKNALVWSGLVHLEDMLGPEVKLGAKSILSSCQVNIE